MYPLMVGNIYLLELSLFNNYQHQIHSCTLHGKLTKSSYFDIIMFCGWILIFKKSFYNHILNIFERQITIRKYKEYLSNTNQWELEHNEVTIIVIDNL